MSDELCFEDDGYIGIDWCSVDKDMLSISLSECGRFAWAARLADGRKAHGVAQMSPEAFEVLRKVMTNGGPTFEKEREQ